MYKNLKKLSALILTLILVFSFVGCGNNKNVTKDTKENAVVEKKSETNYPLTIKDSTGRDVTIDKEPQKIISVGPNITETIYYLGKMDKLIGRTDYCDFPKDVKDIQSIGTLKQPNIEKIVDLKPDLVIGSTHFPKETLEKLESLGVKVVVLYGEESFNGAYNTIEKLGQVLNANDKASEVINNMKKKVEDVKQKVTGKAAPSVYYVIGFGSSGDYTAGKGTFIDELITMAGGKNAAQDAIKWKYSLEKLLEKNPDILICSASSNSKKRLQEANGYKDLDAIKKGKLFEIDTNMIDRQGPRLADGLEAMAKILHPEAFK